MVKKDFLHIAFLVTVIVLKVASASLHMYVSHDEGDDPEEKCELCEHAINNQDLDSAIPDGLTKEKIVISNFSKQDDLYISVQRKLSLDSPLFGRPPPSLV